MMKPFAPWDGFPEAWASIWAVWQAKVGLATVLAAFCSFFNIDEKMMAFLCAAVIGDFLLGMADACKRKRFRCRAVAFGTTKVFWYIVYICVVGLLNSSLSQAMGVRLPLLDLFTAYLVASDCISMTGHLHSMGVPVPPLLIAIARKVRIVTEKKTKKIIKEMDGSKEDDM